MTAVLTSHIVLDDRGRPWIEGPTPKWSKWPWIMLSHASHFIRSSIEFAGLIYAHQWGITYAQLIDDLELIYLAEEPAYMGNRVEWLAFK